VSGLHCDYNRVVRRGRRYAYTDAMHGEMYTNAQAAPDARREAYSAASHHPSAAASFTEANFLAKAYSATSHHAGAVAHLAAAHSRATPQSLNCIDSIITHIYEVRPRKGRRSVDLISDAPPFGRLWYGGADVISNAIVYAEHRSRSHRAVIRVYDAAGNVIETHEHARGEFKKW